MRPLYTRLQEARQRLGIPWHVLERDYLLSWVLAGISRVPELHQTLVFKGGTGSQEMLLRGLPLLRRPGLFESGDDVPKGEAMEGLVRDACEAAARLLDEYASVEIVCERYTEGEPHPGSQEAFTIRARFPWQNRPQTRVMIEATIDERILRPVDYRKVIHGYGEPLEVEVQVYSLEEVIAEKLRAILQHSAMFDRRGWTRSRARDYYDLWRVLSAYKRDLDSAGFDSLLREKCAVRGVGFARPEDFFHDRMLAYVKRTWDQWLGPLVPGLPSFETVIDELRPQVAALISPR